MAIPDPQKKLGILRDLLAKATRLRQAGQLADSLAPLRQAAALAPTDPHVQHDLGLTLLQTGRPAEAIAPFKRAVGLKPDFAHAHWRLGAALENSNDIPRAISSYQTALSHNPSLHEAEYRLGCLLEVTGHRKEAAECYRRASARQPKPANFVAKARAMLIEGQPNEAMRTLRLAIACDPRHAPAQAMLGDILSNRGKFAEASACYTAALEIAPDMVEIYYDYARCHRFTAQDMPLVDRMRSSLARPDLQGTQPIALNLAVGKALDDLGDYRSAMQAFDAADSNRQRITRFDPAAFSNQVQWAIETFDGTFPVVSDGTFAPIFIVGMPRSGTTLVEQILSSHPEIFGAGELPFWNNHGPVLRRNFSVNALAALGVRFTTMARQLSGDARRITDKMPSNFLWLGAIHAALPHAKFIHCRRNPLDTCLSIHQTFFNTQLKFPTGGADLVAYYRGYERVMAHWRRVIAADCLLEIDYESLTSNPEPVIRQMVSYAGLPWNDACLTPERNTRAIETPSKWQVRQPIHRRSVGRADNYLPYLGELLALLE